MTTYSVAEAQHQLAELIDRASRGENIVLTRQGTPVVELRPIGSTLRSVAPLNLDWLASRRVGTSCAKEDAGVLLSRLRDETQR